jgi:hypothetical protein
MESLCQVQLLFILHGYCGEINPSSPTLDVCCLQVKCFRAYAFGAVTTYGKTAAAIMNKKESNFFIAFQLELDLTMRRFSKLDLLNMNLQCYYAGHCVGGAPAAGLGLPPIAFLSWSSPGS